MKEVRRLWTREELEKKSKQGYYLKHFAPLISTKLTKPKKYLPRKEFLRFHMDEVLRK